jgi:C4-dicarboxylate transporter DctM subunit
VAASEGAAASVQTSGAAAPKGDGGDDPPDSAPLEGTGEGPPPGTRLEGLLVSLVALAIIIIPVMACLDRVRGALASATHLTFVAGPLAKVLAFLLPRDMSWGSVYVQNGTLWIGFLGALLAAAGGKHLGLATTNFMKRGRLRSSAEGLSTIVFTVVALALGYASARMVATDRSSGDGDLLPGGFHKWGIELIIPVAFVLMAVRVVMRATDPIAANAGPHGLPSSDELIPIKPLTRRGQLVRWGLIGLTTLLAALVMYVGFRYDNSERIQAAIGRLDGYRTSIKTISLAAMAVAFLLGTPVFIIMAGTAMALFFASDTPVASLPSETFRLVANPSLPAIPLLTIAGYVLASGRSSQRLVRAYKSLLGWMPGGMALMVVFVCGMFTTFTGASGVTILALGGLVFPMLVKDKYPEGFSMGLVTASGSLGLLFPPSLPVILYAVAASTPGSVAPVSVEQLYIGGLIPGLVLLLMVSAYGIHRGIKSGAPRQAFRKGELLAAWRAAKWDLLLPIIVIAAFVSGLATVVEAAALGAAYAILVELIVYRDLHPFRSLPGVLVHAATLVGAVVVLLGVAMGLTNYLVLAEIPTHLVDWVQAHIHSQWLFLIVLNIMLLILGSVLEIYSAIVVLVPLVAPLGVAFNVHPVHLGVIFLANLELGFLCPPMGLNLFLAASRFHKPLPVLYRQALPFLLIMSVGVLFITYVESATMGLLRLFGKQ